MHKHFLEINYFVKQYFTLFFSRGLSITLIYIFNYLVIKRTILEDSGKFLSIISYGGLITQVLLFGLSTLILKSATNLYHFKHKEIVFRLLLTCLFIVTLNTVLGCIFIYICTSFYNISATISLIMMLFPAYVMSLLSIICEFVKSIGKFEKSILFATTLPNLIASFFIIYYINTSYMELYFLYIVSLLIVLVIAIVYFINQIGYYSLNFLSIITLYKKSYSYFWTLFLSQAIFVLDIFFVDIFLTKPEVSVFFVLKKISLIVFLPAQILATIFSQKISILVFKNNRKETKQYMIKILKNIFIISLIPLILLLISGGYLLSFWGNYFVEKGAICLPLLLLGYFFIGISHPYYFFLLLTEKIKKKYSLFLIIFNILFILINITINIFFYKSILTIAIAVMIIQVSMSLFHILYVHFKLKYKS